MWLWPPRLERLESRGGQIPWNKHDHAMPETAKALEPVAVAVAVNALVDEQAPTPAGPTHSVEPR